MLLQTTSKSNQDISTALLVGTYTPTVEVSDLSIQVALDQIAGAGNYSVEVRRQLAGAGAEYPVSAVTEAVDSGVTSHLFRLEPFGASATDVIKVYATGLVTDTTTVDTACEFWGLAARATAGGSAATLYASLAEFKAFIAVRGLAGSVGTDTSDDAVLSDLLEAVSRFVDRQTGRRFYQDSVDADYYYIGDTTNTYVKMPDFCAITTVSVDYTNDRTYTALVLDTDYETLPDNAAAEGRPFTGLFRLPSSAAYFPATRRGVKVTGKRGWPAVPYDIKQATLMIAQSLNANRSGQVSSGKVSITASGIVIRPEDVPAAAQKIIQHYRNLL